MVVDTMQSLVNVLQTPGEVHALFFSGSRSERSDREDREMVVTDKGFIWYI